MIMLMPALITHVSDVPHAVAQPYTPGHARTYDYGYSCGASNARAVV